MIDSSNAIDTIDICHLLVYEQDEEVVCLFFHFLAVPFFFHRHDILVGKSLCCDLLQRDN